MMLIRDNEDIKKFGKEIQEIKDRKQRKLILLNEISARANSLKLCESLDNLVDLHELIIQFENEFDINIQREIKRKKKKLGGFSKCNIQVYS